MLNSEVSAGTNSRPICYWYVLRLWELIWLCLKIEFKIRIFSLSVLYYSYSNQKIQFIFHKKLSYADHPWYLCIAKLWSVIYFRSDTWFILESSKFNKVSTSSMMISACQGLFRRMRVLLGVDRLWSIESDC